jgi:hypothetical protein
MFTVQLNDFIAATALAFCAGFTGKAASDVGGGGSLGTAASGGVLVGVTATGVAGAEAAAAGGARSVVAAAMLVEARWVLASCRLPGRQASPVPQ